VAQPLPRKTIARYKAMKILIATDGSKYGTAALERGCDIAAHMPDSEVKVLTAYELRP
jgi:nucleotide-binding universal stress UspA family protein